MRYTLAAKSPITQVSGRYSYTPPRRPTAFRFPKINPSPRLITAMRSIFKSVGPAIIVAAVVLGPGSILTSSTVGAHFGLIGLAVVAGAAVLMAAMVALAARLGAVYEGSLGDELAARLGRPITVAIGLILFILVALFQSSNNTALVGGLEPLVGGDGLSFAQRAAVLIVANLAIVACLYRVKNLYSLIENAMKLLMGLMTLAFVANCIFAYSQPRGYTPVAPTAPNWLSMLGMIGTTFSVAGAFYQAYLVKEKGWTIDDARSGLKDSILGTAMLGMVTSVILLTSYRVFYGRPEPVQLASVGDVAAQLEPLFGPSARIIFAFGILAGALSSFLVNALIGGTVLSDCLGKGGKLSDRWPLNLTALALLVGMLVSIAALANEGSTVLLITLAQALTVIGIPALALALIYLGTRPELTGKRAIPKPIIWLACLGFVVACGVACLTAVKVYDKIM